MNNHQQAKRFNRYTLIETVFFIVFFFLFPIFTDIEYKLKEKPCEQCDQELITIIIHRLVFGLFQIFPFIVLYKILLHKLLLKKRYFSFLGAFVVFLFLLDLYIVYVEYWTISQLDFLPGNITKDAARWFKIKTFFHFSIVYIINQTLVFAALAYFINYAKQEERINALKQAKLQADLDYLKAQIQPHFFFNTLNNIYSLALQRSAATAPLIARLSEMMRYVIYETASLRVALKKEIDFLKNYVEVESVRYNEKIKINFDAQGIEETASIEPLLLLPLIENMFKHGLQHETETGFADIVICVTGNELNLQACNSKPLTATNQSKQNGLGLVNVKKRLQLLYPDRHTLTIQEDARSYEVFLTLKLN